MKKLLLIALIFVSGGAMAQNVGIGTANPDESAILDLKSSNKGFLLPRLTEKQKTLIPQPAEGLMIYQTDASQGVYLYQGGNWKNMGSANVTTSTISGVTANIAPTYTANYLLSGDGTSTPASSGVYFASGKMGLGTTTGTSVLNVFDPVSTTSAVAKFSTFNNGISIKINSNGSTEFASDYGVAPMYFSNGGVKRMTISDNGNVGFGTATPNYKLDVFEPTSSGLTLASFGTLNNGIAFKVNNDGTTEFVSQASVAPMYFSQGTTKRVAISDNGYFGVGVLRPQQPLDVLGSIQQSAVTSSVLKADVTGKLVAATAGTDFVTSGTNTVGTIAKFSATGTVANSSITEAAVTNANEVKLNSKSAGYLAVGDFGAGTPMTVPTGYRLVVQDGILTEKVKVAVRTQGDWADYVFEPNYSLMPLNEVEQFVKENKHLPNVPSADQMVEQGVEVGKTSKMFMEKIEELTLYMIELKKEIEALKAENAKLKK